MDSARLLHISVFLFLCFGTANAQGIEVGFIILFVVVGLGFPLCIFFVYLICVCVGVGAYNKNRGLGMGGGRVYGPSRVGIGVTQPLYQQPVYATNANLSMTVGQVQPGYANPSTAGMQTQSQEYNYNQPPPPYNNPGQVSGPPPSQPNQQGVNIV